MIDFKAMDELYQKCRKLAIDKNNDYGTKSLYLFDGLSILIRMNDKIQRLNNCVDKGKLSINETIKDTIMDLINYSFYYLLYLENKLEVK